MPASPTLLGDTQQVTHARIARNKKGARVLAFTRHKRELARLVTWDLPAAARSFMHVLLATADDEGTSLVQVETILALMPRSTLCQAYVVRTIDRMAVLWRKRGCLTWTRILPLQRFPPTARHPEGVRTAHGGRVWRINLAALRGETDPLSTDGMERAGSDLQIRSGSDLQIRSSDPVSLLRRDKMDPGLGGPPARSPAERPDARPLAAQVASETSRRAPDGPPARAPRAQREPPAPTRPVSGAPQSARAPAPAPSALGRERLERERPRLPEPPREPPTRVRASDVQALLEQLARPRRS